MKDVRIGKTSFNTEVLKACESIKDAQKRFANHDKDIVKRAFNEAKKIKK